MTRIPNESNMSKGQEFITRYIEKFGLVVESEFQIGKYRVDCYMPELKLVVEYDGPYMSHSPKANMGRDAELVASGKVKRVCHIRGTKPKDLKYLDSWLEGEER